MIGLMKLEYHEEKGGFVYQGLRISSSDPWKSGSIDRNSVITDDFFELCSLVQGEGYEAAEVTYAIGASGRSVITFKRFSRDSTDEAVLFSMKREFGRGHSSSESFYVFNESRERKEAIPSE